MAMAMSTPTLPGVGSPLRLVQRQKVVSETPGVSGITTALDERREWCAQSD